MKVAPSRSARVASVPGGRAIGTWYNSYEVNGYITSVLVGDEP